MPETAFKCDTEVQDGGIVELSVPFPPGAHVVVLVIERTDGFADLLSASETTLDFWDNAFDDEDWNDA